ncbi:MAG: dihydrolipoamide acetyltransferase family protein [Opitutaceae bacterium]|nr:dihydrolipoamide acetyltransferase family protein [Opitutaceae bacterium]
MAQIIDMPKLSDTMTVGTLVKWLKQEGDAVKSGDMLAEIETAKATMGLESFFDGVLLRQFVKVGTQIPIGAPLCAVGKKGEKVEAPVVPSAPERPVAATPVRPSPPSPPAPVPAGPPLVAKQPGTTAVPRIPASTPQPAPLSDLPSPASGSSTKRTRISPLARKLAAEKGLDYALLKGSGPGGRIVQADILAAEKSGAATPPSRSPSALAAAPSLLARSPIQTEELVPVSNIRATIARRLVESKTQIPHFYLEIEIDADPLLALRAQLNRGLEKDGVKLSVNDFILKASAGALRAVPTVNCSWENEGIRHHAAAHVSFAVALDDGLITPVIRDTHLKTIFQISTEARELAGLAKARKLKPEQYTGGTFCISNLGMLGIARFTAIINPPNAAILAIGMTVKKPVVKDDRIVIGQCLSLFLSCDHRVVDGATGAKYLAALKELLEKPALLLV